MINLKENLDGLESVILVASRPPVPPFSGATSKTLCALDGISSKFAVELVAFCDQEDMGTVRRKFDNYWQNHEIDLHMLPLKNDISSTSAFARMKFRTTLKIEGELLRGKLEFLRWDDPKTLIVFDDIVFAPFLVEYGKNAIISPHDCMSCMFLDHFKNARLSIEKLRYFLQYSIARFYEKRYYHCALLTHVITEREKFRLHEINSEARYFVVPNADLLNPGLLLPDEASYDVLIWGDLSIASIAKGVRAFLKSVRQDRLWSEDTKMVVVGRITSDEARNKVGDALAKVEYSQYLENDNGELRRAKIFVVPDIGGVGIKNRCINVVATGNCLACLDSQMAGLGYLRDVGAINSPNFKILVDKIRIVLEENLHYQIGSRARELYSQKYNQKFIRNMWSDMISYALNIRDRIIEVPGFSACE